MLHSFPMMIANSVGGGGFIIEGSGLFDGAGDLVRTPSTDTNNQLFSIDIIFKRTKLGETLALFSAGTGTSAEFRVFIDTSDNLQVEHVGGSGTFDYTTTQVFRDPAAYNNLRIDVDMSQAAADRVILKLQGTRVTDFISANNPSSAFDTFVNTTNPHYIGVRADGSTNQGKFYISRFLLSDGNTAADTGEVTDDGFWSISDASGLTYSGNSFLIEGGVDMAAGTDSSTPDAGYAQNDSIPTMTNFTAPSGEAIFDSSHGTTYAAWKAFDKNTSTRWARNAAGQAGWIGYDFGTGKVIKKMILQAPSSSQAEMPKNYTIDGWNGSAWVTITTITNGAAFSANEQRVHTFTNTTSYNKYRVNITASEDGANCTMGELAMFEGGDGVNHFTPTGSIISTSDSPTNGGDDDEYGNLPTLNVLAPTYAATTTFSNGNRTVTNTSASALTNAPFTFGVNGLGNTGIYYCEFNIDVAGNDTTYAGMALASWAGWGGSTGSYLGYGIGSAGGGVGEGVAILQTGSSGSGNFDTWSNGNNGTPGSVTVANNDRLCAALDTATGKCWVGFFDVSGDQQYWLDNDGTERTTDVPASGSNQNHTFTAADGDIVFAVACRAFGGNNGTLTIKPHPDDWLGTPPSGAKSVSTQTLQTPDVINYEDHYTVIAGISHSNGSTTSVTLPWNTSTYETMVTVKRTDSTGSWYRVDTLRGGTKAAQMEGAAPDITNSDGGFSGTSFVITSDYATGTYLLEATKYGLVADTAANEEGSINTLKTTSNNDSKAFMLTWTGTASNGTIGHGLDVAPDFIVACDTDTAANCDRFVFHKDVPSAGRLFLDTSAVADTNANGWQNTAPSTTLVSVGTGSFNTAGTSVMWGYASSSVFDFGIYDSNLSADGPMINLSGSPATFGAKRNDGTWNWVQAYQVLGNNENYQYLENNNTTAVNSSATVNEVDFLSNGIKMRDAGNNNFNGTAGADHYYYAFGIQPIQGDGKINQGRAR
tara:strand:+ start:954 stop:3920 length:2967 start_codon:yes stop_codon:yes gene_type:complete